METTQSPKPASDRITAMNAALDLLSGIDFTQAHRLLGILAYMNPAALTAAVAQLHEIDAYKARETN